jgi:hypothetical protein
VCQDCRAAGAKAHRCGNALQATQGIDDFRRVLEHGQVIQMLYSIRRVAMVSALAMLPACTGRGQSTSNSPPPPATKPGPSASPVRTVPSPGPPPWLAVDSVARTATLSLEVTAPEGAQSALINGFRAGEAQVVVPLGWTVKWNWRNADSTSPHSLVVMMQREKIPLEGGRPAFSNAMSRMVTAGLPVGQTDQTTFVADEAGWFWILCGVPGHALKGEWIELRVDPEARTASIKH